MFNDILTGMLVVYVVYLNYRITTLKYNTGSMFSKILLLVHRIGKK